MHGCKPNRESLGKPSQKCLLIWLMVAGEACRCFGSSPENTRCYAAGGSSGQVAGISGVPDEPGAPRGAESLGARLSELRKRRSAIAWLKQQQNHPKTIGYIRRTCSNTRRWLFPKLKSYLVMIALRQSPTEYVNPNSVPADQAMKAAVHQTWYRRFSNNCISWRQTLATNTLFKLKSAKNYTSIVTLAAVGIEYRLVQIIIWLRQDNQETTR